MNTKTYKLSPLLFLVVLLLIGCQVNPNQNPDSKMSLVAENVRKKAKQIMTETWIFYGFNEDGSIDYNSIQREEKYRYNVHGKLIEYTLRLGGEKQGVDCKTIYKYENDNKIEEIEYKYFIDQINPQNREVFTSNSYNQISESIYYLKDSYPRCKYLYKYNKAGKLIEKQELSYTVVMEYINDKIVERFDPEASLSSRESYKYDSKNYLVEKICFDIENGKGEKIQNRLVYVNDGDGNPLKIIEYNGDRLKAVTENVYISGQLSDEIYSEYNSFGKLTSTFHSTKRYNEDGEIIEQIELNEKDVPTLMCKISHEYY